MGTEWEAFLEYKKLIGYPEIIKWIKEGQQSEKELIEIKQEILKLLLGNFKGDLYLVMDWIDLCPNDFDRIVFSDPKCCSGSYSRIDISLQYQPRISLNSFYSIFLASYRKYVSIVNIRKKCSRRSCDDVRI